MADHIIVRPTDWSCFHKDWHNLPPDCPKASSHFNANCDRYPCTRINSSTRVWGATPEECRAKIRAHWADTEIHPPEDLLEMLAAL